MAYRKVYFRIRTEAYVSERSSDAGKDAFKEESRHLFQELGWTLEPGHNGVCDTVTKDRQDLYLHPSVFSGVMEEVNIPPLQEQLSKARTFHSFGFNCHEEYRDLSDEAYRAELEAKRDEITAYILKRCRTKRSNLYIVAPVAVRVAEHFEVCRLCDKDRHNKIGNQFVAELMDKLLQKGWLVAAETSQGKGIRTATPKERGISRQPAAQVDGQITIRNQENDAPKKKKVENSPRPAYRRRSLGQRTSFSFPCCSHWCLCFICLRFFGGVGNSFVITFRLYLAYQRKGGRKEMATKSKYLNIPIEAADHRKLKLLCLYRDCTLKSILQEIVHSYLENAPKLKGDNNHGRNKEPVCSDQP